MSVDGVGFTLKALSPRHPGLSPLAVLTRHTATVSNTRTNTHAHVRPEFRQINTLETDP